MGELTYREPTHVISKNFLKSNNTKMCIYTCFYFPSFNLSAYFTSSQDSTGSNELVKGLLSVIPSKKDYQS